MSNDPPPPRGMPILSGPPPVTVGSACQKCGKEFNALWRRGHACGHCGHEFCSSCLEGQALMPRRARTNSGGPLAEIRGALRGQQQSTGYDVESVCAYCLGMLQVTAAPIQTLRTLPLKRLKDYLAAYDIPAIGVKEKEDLVEAVIKARNPATGTLGASHEAYYRRKSVPGARRRAAAGSSRPNARPPPGQPPGGYPPPPQYGYQYGYNYGQPGQRPPPPPHGQPGPGYQYNYNYQPRARPPPPQARPPPQQQSRQQPKPAAKPAPKPTPPPPVPTLLSLVPLPKSYLSTLSIGTLKAILYENHVRVDFSQVLEKSELVARVAELVDDERRRLERQRREEEREERERAAAQERQRAPHAPPRPAAAPAADGDLIDLEGGEAATSSAAGSEGAQAPGGAETAAAESTAADGATVDGQGSESVAAEGAKADGETGDSVNSTASEANTEPKLPRSPPTGPPAEDRGLCVVCQDEEATLAVVDCGHLAMCAHCSDLVMATTKVCPMCRTRIVTPQRLIRIYRV